MAQRFSLESLEPRILLAGDGPLDPRCLGSGGGFDATGSEFVSLQPGVAATGSGPGEVPALQDGVDSLFEGVGEDWPTAALAEGHHGGVPGEGGASTRSEPNPSNGRVRPAGDSDPAGGPAVIEVTDVLRLTVSNYSLVPGGAPGDPFASATGATLEFLHNPGLGPVTLGRVDLFGSAADITGFRAEAVQLTVSEGGLGAGSGRVLEFVGLNFNLPVLQVTRGVEGWGVDSGAMSLTIESARLLPGRSDLLTGRMWGVAGTLDLSDGTFALVGQAELDLGGQALVSGQVTARRETTTSVVLDGGQGTVALDLFRVAVTSGSLFVGVGARFGPGGGIEADGARGFLGSGAALEIAVARVAHGPVSDTRQWTGVSGGLATLSAVGFSDFVAQVSHLSIRYNGASGDADGIPVSGNEASPVSWSGVFTTGPPDSALTGTIPLTLRGVVQIQSNDLLRATGEFSVRRVSRDGVTVVALETTAMSVFLGSGAQWDSAMGISTSGATGFASTSAHAVLAFASGQGNGDSRRWMALEVGGVDLQAVGLPEGTIVAVRSLDAVAAASGGSVAGTPADTLDWSQWLGVESTLSGLPGLQPVEVSGIVEIAIDDFVRLSAPFQVIHFRTESVEAGGANGSRVDLDTVVMTLTEATVFFGTGGGFAGPDSPTPMDLSGAVGFLASGADVAWAWSRVRGGGLGDTRRWFGLVAQADRFDPVGFAEDALVTLTSTGVFWNHAAGSGTDGSAALPLAWSAVLGTASPLASLRLENHLGARGVLTLTVPNLALASGTFTLERVSKEGVRVIALVASEFAVFVGSGGGQDPSGAIVPGNGTGFHGTSAKMTLAWASGTGRGDSRRWIGLALQGRDLAATGFDGGVSASVRSLTLGAARISGSVDGTPAAPIDWKHWLGAESPLGRLKGPQSIQVAGIVQIGIGGSMLLSSEFSLIHHRKVGVDVTGGSGSLVDLDTVLMSLTGASLFFGVGGRFATEDSAEPLDLSSAFGIAATGIAVDWAWSRVRQAGDGEWRRWQGLVATAASAGVVGLPAHLVAGLNFVGAYWNTASGTGAAGDASLPLSWGDVLGPVSPLAVLDANEYRTVRASMSLAVDGFVTVTGDFGFALAGLDLVAASVNGSASLTAGTGIQVAVHDATVGLRWTVDRKMALMTTGGTVEMSLGAGFVSAIASGAGVSWNDTGTSVDETVTVGVGTTSLSAPLKVEDGTAVVWLPAFEATIAGFGTLNAHLALRKGADSVIEAVATEVSTALTAGPVLHAGVTGGTGGLILDEAGKLAFSVSGAPFLDLGSGIAVAGADAVTVSYNDTSGPVRRTLRAAVDGQDPEVVLDLATDTRLVQVKGLSATLRGGLSLRGDLAMGRNGDLVEGVGSGMSLVWDSGDGLSLGVGQATVALVLGASGGVAWRITGVASLPHSDPPGTEPEFRISDLTFAYNSTGAAINRTLQVGSLEALLRTDAGTVDSPYFAVSGIVGVTAPGILQISGNAVLTLSLDTVTNRQRLMIGVTDLTGTAGSDAYTIMAGHLGVVFISGFRPGESFGVAIDAVLRGRLVADPGSAEIGIRYRRNTSNVAVTANIPVGGQSAPVAFSEGEVATPADGPFTEFLVENAVLQLGNLVIEGNYQSTSTTSDGVSTTRVTQARIAFGDRPLFTLAADELVYRSYSRGASLGGVEYRGEVQQVQIQSGRIELGKIVTLFGTFSLVRGVVAGESSPRITLGFARTGLWIHRGEDSYWLKISGNGAFTYSDDDGLSLGRFEVTDFEFLPKASGMPRQGDLQPHGDGDGFDPITGDLIPEQPHVPTAESSGPLTLRGFFLAVEIVNVRLASEGRIAVEVGIKMAFQTAVIQGPKGVGVDLLDTDDADAFAIAGRFDFEALIDPLNNFAVIDPDLVGFRLQADLVRVRFGDLMTFETLGVRFDPTATGDQTLLGVERSTVTVLAGPLQISGTADRFSILGSGAFRADAQFGVRLSVLPGAGEDLGMPSWMPVRIEEMGLRWRSINEAPLDVVLTLSASVTGIEGLPGAVFGGSIQGLEVDIGLLRQGRFPIIKLDSIGVSIRAEAFGGRIHGVLVGGLVRLDADGFRIRPDAPVDTPVADRILFVGVEGGYEVAGLSGFSIRFAVSELGPLGVLVTVNSPVGIPIDPTGVTGLAITSLTAGVDFYSSLPSITTAEELRRPGLSGRAAPDPAVWLETIQGQVATQYRAIRDTPDVGAVFGAFSAPMIFTGGGRIISTYIGASAFNADLEIRIDTTGRFLAIGSFNFLADSASVTGRLYGDLSRIAKGEGRFVFLATIPDQTQLLELGGELGFGFRDASGQEVVFGTPVAPVPGGGVPDPAFDAVLAGPGPDRMLDAVQWNDGRTVAVRLVALGGAAVGSLAWNAALGRASLLGPDGVSVELGAPQSLRDGVAMFRLPDGFRCAPGTYRVQLSEGAFRNGEGARSNAADRQFTIQGGRVSLTASNLGSGFDVGILNRDRFIDLTLTGTDGSMIAAESWVDGGVGFSLLVHGARVDLVEAPIRVAGDVYRIRLPTGVSIPIGDHQLVVAAGSFVDTNGETNLETLLPIQVHGVRMTLLGAVGGVLPLDGLSRSGHLDVRFTPTAGAALDPASILDSAPEWSLTGAAAEGVLVSQTGVESLGDGVFRYRFKGGFTEGDLLFVTATGSALDTAGQGVLATTTVLRVEGLHAVLVQPVPSGVISRSVFESQGRLLVQFTTPLGSPLDLDSITDAAPELQISGSAVSGLVLSGVGQRVEIDGQDYIAYGFTGRPGTGEFVVSALADSWQDQAGHRGQAGVAHVRVVQEASTFVVRLVGSVLVRNPVGAQREDPLFRVDGDASLVWQSVPGAGPRLNLSVSGTTRVFGLGALGVGAGSFSVDLGSSAGGDGWLGGGFPAIWGALRLDGGLGDASVDLGVTVQARVLLRFNSTSEDRRLQLSLPGTTEPEILTVKARTFALGGTGSVQLGSSLTLDGTLDLQIGSAKAVLVLDGRIGLPIGELNVLGRLDWYYGDGVAGVLESVTRLDASGFSLKGTFLVEANTTSIARQIPRLRVDPSGTVLGTEPGTLAPDVVRISFGGVLSVSGFVDLNGSALLEATSDRVSMSLEMVLDLGSLGRSEFRSAALIWKESDGTSGFALQADAPLDLRIADNITITGLGQVRINTSRSTEQLGVVPSTKRIEFDGSLRLFALQGSASGRFLSVDGVRSLDFSADLDFFSVATLGVSGWFRPDGTYRIAGSAEVFLQIPIARLSGSLDLLATQDAFSLSVSGALDVKNPLAWMPSCKEWLTLSGIRGDIQIGKDGARLMLRRVIFDVPIEVDFSWGTPPAPMPVTNGIRADWVELDAMGDRGGEVRVVDRGQGPLEVQVDAGAVEIDLGRLGASTTRGLRIVSRAGASVILRNSSEASIPLARLSIEGAGDVRLADDLTLDGSVSIQTSGTLVLAGSLNLNSGGHLAVRGASRILLDRTGAIRLTGRTASGQAGTLTVSGGLVDLEGSVEVDSGAVTIAAAQRLHVGGRVRTGAGMTLTGAAGVELDSSAVLESRGTSGLVVESRLGGVWIAGGAAVVGRAGVRLAARGDVAVTGIHGATVSIESSLGSILDGGDPALDVTAEQLRLVSATGVGTGLRGRIEVAAGHLDLTVIHGGSALLDAVSDLVVESATLAGTGDLDLRSTGGAMTVVETARAAQGTVRLEARDGLRINGSVWATGDVMLTMGGSGLEGRQRIASSEGVLRVETRTATSVPVRWGSMGPIDWVCTLDLRSRDGVDVDPDQGGWRLGTAGRLRLPGRLR